MSREAQLFEYFCRTHLTIESGAPLVLEPFQKVILGDYFDGLRESLILLPKKTSKSTLVGCLALFKLVTSADVDIALAAASRDQALLIHRQASSMVRRSPYLSQRLHPTMREIRSRKDGGVLRVLAADVDTVDGWLGDLAICDELHRHKTIDLYSILLAGIGPRNGRMVTISTAGDDEDSPLGRFRQAAYELPSVERAGTYTYARGEHFAMHEYALDPKADRHDMAVVKTVHPESWSTVETLQAAHDSPSMAEWTWARFYCNIWERGEDAAIRPQDWDACESPGRIIPDGAEVWIGLDLGWKRDTTAIVPLHVAKDGRRVCAGALVLEPPGDGGMLDELLIEDALIGLHRRYQVLGVVYDPHAGAQQLAQRLEREQGMTFVEHSQDSSPMALAASRLMEAIRTRQLVHDGDRILRAHVLNAAQRTVSGERWKFDRPRRGGRVPIDALTALSMALSVAAEPPKRRSGVVHIY